MTDQHQSTKRRAVAESESKTNLLQRLPSPLAACVISFLTVHDHLTVAARVSKAWLALAQHPLSWDAHVEVWSERLPPAAWAVSKWGFRPASLRIDQRLIYFPGFRFPTVFLQSLAPSLTSLAMRASHTWLLGSLALPSLTALSVSPTPLHFALSEARLPALQRLELDDCQQLHASVAPHLTHFRGELGHRDSTPIGFFERCPRLESLTLVFRHTNAHAAPVLLAIVTDRKWPLRALEIVVDAFESRPLLDAAIAAAAALPSLERVVVLASQLIPIGDEQKRTTAERRAEVRRLADCASLRTLVLRGFTFSVADCLNLLADSASDRHKSELKAAAAAGSAAPVALRPFAAQQVLFERCVVDVFASTARSRHTREVPDELQAKLLTPPERGAAFQRAFAGVPVGCPSCFRAWTVPPDIFCIVPWKLK